MVRNFNEMCKTQDMHSIFHIITEAFTTAIHICFFTLVPMSGSLLLCSFSEQETVAHRATENTRFGC